MNTYKRVATRKQAQIETTLHAQDPSNLPERLKNKVEELEEELEVEMKKEKEKKYYVMNQLDEPQKPVIPQFVADYIEKWKHKGLKIYEWFTFDNNDMDEDIDKWLYNNTIEENRRRKYLLIDAIRYGYEVEKEKLYHVVNEENYFMLRKLDGLVLTMQASPAMSRDEFGKDTRFMLTKKEIKNYDKRYWAFAEDVVE